jgi:hypothetical protein
MHVIYIPEMQISSHFFFAKIELLISDNRFVSGLEEFINNNRGAIRMALRSRRD